MRLHRLRDILRLGRLGRIMYSSDPGHAVGVIAFRSQLGAMHIRPSWPGKGPSFWERHMLGWHQLPDGRWARPYDLGSGLVTNVGVTAMANDFNWPAPSGGSLATLKLANFHASGTGVTAAAATDVTLQTSAGPAPVAGTQSLISAANLQKYRTVATLAYTSTLAITEWGLHSDGTLSITTGSPFTATTATTGTATGTPYTASSTTVQGQTQKIVRAGTTAVYGLILSNTTSVLTIPAWYNVADGLAGSTPGGTETFTIRPVMWDHKVFSAINVVNGDSIVFTYDLTVNSGG